MLHTDEVMSVFPCRISLETNISYRLYCEPANRPSKAESRFVGFYAYKRFGHLACIRTIVTGAVHAGGFVVHRAEKGTLSREEAGRIDGAIRRLRRYFDPDFSRVEQRFYLLEEIHATDFEKSSKYGLWRGGTSSSLVGWTLSKKGITRPKRLQRCYAARNGNRTLSGGSHPE